MGKKQFLSLCPSSLQLYVYIYLSFSFPSIPGQPEAGLLIVGRSWRYVRIFHGFYESTVDEKMKELKKELNVLEKEILSEYHKLKEAGSVPNLEMNAKLYGEMVKVLGDYLEGKEEEELHIGEHLHDQVHHALHHTHSEDKVNEGEK